MGACFGKRKWCTHIDYNYCGSQGGDYGRYPSVIGCGNFVDQSLRLPTICDSSPQHDRRYCYFHDENSHHRLTIHLDGYYLYLKEKYPHRIRCSCIAEERQQI
jgi:hypothetical protein